MHLTSALLALVVVFALCACSSSGVAGKIATEAKAANHASSASCKKVGLMVFVGARQDVFDCRMTNVPFLDRPITNVHSPTVDRCFVYASGHAYDVTVQLDKLGKAGADTSGFVCVAR